ncbi:MAG TPA: glycosyltransferase family 9 protein [Pyrinomonadaceae bacterium]|nr:glycosyltransferase family 9 protein [Pyrinomonadaceae bacterium]
MKSLLEKPEQATPALHALCGDLSPAESKARPLAPARWDWSEVGRVLVVRLRSIGDTVLATPSLYALRRFLPHARIDILLESWVAPLLEGFDAVDEVIEVERGSTASRARVARRLRSARYDVAYNLHGGTTATLLTRASGAKHRVGYSDYQYSRLLNHTAPPATELWGTPKTHSVEQQLALLGWTGVPVSDRPRTRLCVTEEAAASVAERLRAAQADASKPLALIHPAAAFETKQWAASNFARVVEELSRRGFDCVAVAGANEGRTIAELIRESSVRLKSFTDLSLPEVTALAARSRLFVGNDSGVAHIAAAVGTPSVVIFGSSNIAHWRPWATAPSEVVREELACQPCPGYTCSEFDAPECIRRIPVERVTAAINKVVDGQWPVVS